ncbi:UNVERIFIED_CONTAM: hypothetical protein K2H54_060954 [Gekko kuhli]
MPLKMSILFKIFSCTETAYLQSHMNIHTLLTGPMGSIGLMSRTPALSVQLPGLPVLGRFAVIFLERASHLDRSRPSCHHFPCFSLYSYHFLPVLWRYFPGLKKDL